MGTRKPKMRDEEINDIANAICGKDNAIENAIENNKEPQARSFQNMSSNSSYVITQDESLLSRDVDRWMGCGRSMESTGVQDSRVMRPSLFTMTTTIASNIWYILAMVLPVFSIEHLAPLQRTCPFVANIEVFVARLAALCTTLRIRFRRLAEEELATELFATVMDIFIVIYAIGFLVMSIYQATLQ